MNKITFSTRFLARWPDIQLGCISCHVKVEPPSEEMWKEIGLVENELRSTCRIEQVSSIPAIYASRKAYRALGKDPARYRLSAEALIRRVLKGEELYRLNNLVDLINLTSIKTGFSIGGYDVEKIDGEVILSVGQPDDLYEALGRGILNIDSLPVLRDLSGALGSPTSDSVRTGVSMETRHFLMVFFGFGAFNQLPEAMCYARGLLERYANADEIQEEIIKP